VCPCCPSLLVVMRRGEGERPKGGCIKGGWGDTERELGFVAEVEDASCCCANWSLFNLKSKSAGSAGDEIYVVVVVVVQTYLKNREDLQKLLGHEEHEYVGHYFLNLARRPIFLAFPRYPFV
jgi:hypothetical protein